MGLKGARKQKGNVLICVYERERDVRCGLAFHGKSLNGCQTRGVCEL